MFLAWPLFSLQAQIPEYNIGGEICFLEDFQIRLYEVDSQDSSLSMILKGDNPGVLTSCKITAATPKGSM